MKRTRIAQGIYQDKYGFAVTWRDRGRQREKRFPIDTPLATLRAFRKQQKKTAVDGITARGEGGSFPRDVVRYLKSIKHKPCYASYRCKLKAWVTIFGRGSRHVITREKIIAVLGGWSVTYKPREIRQRLNALRQVFLLCDGFDIPTPCHGITAKRGMIPKIKKDRPKGVPDNIIAIVAANLAHQEKIGRLRDGKTRARFLVLATCGKRPCQVMRADRSDVDFDAREWDVEPAKNSEGGILGLNNEMFAAWKAFDDANAWGKYDGVSFAKTLRRNGWPAGVRPYNLRHQTLQTLSDRGVDFADVQQAGGHASPETTRNSYVPMERARSKAASAKIDGRFDPAIFAPREPRKWDKAREAMAQPPLGTVPS